MVVKDLMSINLRTIRPDDPVELAAEIMRAEDIGIVPVCDSSQHLLGVLTDRDIVVRKGYGRPVQEIVTEDPATVHSREDVHSAALKFSLYGVRRLPVLENDRLVGMFTLKDLAQKKVFTAEIGHIIYQISNYEKLL